MILEDRNAWAHDWENFPNASTFVAREFRSDKKKVRHKFVFSEWRNDWEEFLRYLDTRPILVGYANLEYDGQLTQWAYNHGGEFDYRELYNFAQTLPIADKEKSRFDLPYSEWDLIHTNLDLYRLNHYDNASRSTSLKWLEFTTRQPKLKDLPIPPGTIITKTKIAPILTYNTYDVDVTHAFAYKCADMIQFRAEMARELRQKRIYNMSDSSVGSYIFEDILIKKHKLKKAKLKQGSVYEEIKGKDVVFPYVQVNHPEFSKVLKTFKERIYLPKKGEKYITDIAGSQYEQQVMVDDMVFVYGSGGLHACYKAGEYKKDKDHVIMSIDVKSYYPNIAIQNKIFPAHIGEMFCQIYNSVYERRGTFPKGTSMNYGLKIALNGVYGKSNAKHGIFKDIMYLLKITVNGQLMMTMLAEEIMKLGRVLMVNTDGLEVKVHKDNVDKVMAICEMWEMVTNLELEYERYEKLVIRDVNNYIAITEKGKAKRKGFFEIYYDITEEDGKPHSYHKNPGGTIIPQAIFNYYYNNIPVEETINNCNDIFEFCYGLKSKKNFEYWLITAEENGVIDIEKRDDRVIRYYISPKGANIFKFYKNKDKGNLEGVNRGQLVSLAMNIMKSEIEVEKDGEIIEKFNVNRQFYIDEAYKVIDLINSREPDNAYKKFMKKLEKEQKLKEKALSETSPSV